MLLVTTVQKVLRRNPSRVLLVRHQVALGLITAQKDHRKRLRFQTVGWVRVGQSHASRSLVCASVPRVDTVIVMSSRRDVVSLMVVFVPLDVLVGERETCTAHATANVLRDTTVQQEQNFSGLVQTQQRRPNGRPSNVVRLQP